MSIKVKPIIDIAVAVEDFPDVLACEEELRENGFYYCPQTEDTLVHQLLFACGSDYDGSGEMQMHFIHVVLMGSEEWIHYIRFRDYLNRMSFVAKEYEALKESLAKQDPIDTGREKYLKGKHNFIVRTLKKADDFFAGPG